jgi:phosphoribosyl-AMP cyclohydrolase
MSQSVSNFTSRLVFNEQGLIPVIVQQVDTREVLMMAWMNAESIALTLETAAATYWSRSRSELWVKGATSGNTQRVISLSYDCDSDALLMVVDQTGAACHTGDRTCFDAVTVHPEVLS